MPINALLQQTILLISPEPWDAHTVSKHHYATTLAGNGARVYFLNPPDNALKTPRIESVDGSGSLFTVTAKSVATGLRFYPGFLRRRLEVRWLAELERIIDEKIDVIWLFENSRFFDMTFAEERLKIYHQVDLNQDFHAEAAAASADIVFCTSDFIKDRLNKYADKVYKIHHGLAKSQEGIPLTVSEIEHFGNQQVNATYIGNLEIPYLDIDLLKNLINSLTNVKFHLVGGYSESGLVRNALKDAPNVHWWGKVSSLKIPALLEKSDMLLVTYSADNYKDQSSPHKFMEYFDSGKIIVSTYTDEYKDKKHLLEMSKTAEDFLKTFGKVVDNLDFYNSEEKMIERQLFAQEHTYRKQLERISEKLSLHGINVTLTTENDQ